MNKLILSPLLISMAAVPSAWAKHAHNEAASWAKVTNVQPIIRTVEQRIPEEECWNESVPYRRHIDNERSYTGTVLGGIIGGAIGHNITHNRRNKDVGTVIGAVLGASVGHDISQQGYSHSNSQISYVNREHCEIHQQIRYEEKVIGYHVWYQYHGHEYKTRMDHHPGKKIKIRINVEPY